MWTKVSEEMGAWHTAINNVGQVVGYSSIVTVVSGGHRAFIWDKVNGMQCLGTLDCDCGRGWGSWAYGINDLGQVVGASGVPTGPNFYAFIWDRVSGMKDIGNLGYENTVAMSINSMGQVVGYGNMCFECENAFIWDKANGIREIVTEAHAYAYAINNAGVIVGGSGIVGHAYLYTPSATSFTLETSVLGGHGALNPVTGQQNANTVVALMATPDNGYQVKAWTGTDNDSLKTNPNAITMTCDRIVTVEFEQIPGTPVSNMFGLLVLGFCFSITGARVLKRK